MKVFSGLLLVVAAFVFCPAHGTANAETSDAFSQNKRLGRGVNVLGYDPIWKDQQNARFQKKYFRLIKEAGFNHVRVNLHPLRDKALEPDQKLSAAWFETLDWTLRHALANHLMVILDFHEFQKMGEAPEGNKQRMLAVWRQIAEHCKESPDDVLFEILNEPNKKLTPALWNPLLREALAIIRESNLHRTVVIGPTSWNNINDLDKLDLPEEDRNLIVTVHYYNPFQFTHQGAPWAGLTGKVGVPWNGTEKEQQAIGKDFDKAQAWAEKHQRPIYLGEFGAYDKAEMSSRARWANFVARQAEKRSWSWAWWQFDNDFILYDVKKDVWVEPILRSLVPAAADAPATTDNWTSHCKPRPWPAEKAWQWYKQQPWICGFNYIPATAINYTEMWQKETFDPKTIDEELALAEQVRFNSLRCVLQYLVWEHDPDGFKQRMDQFLTICHKRGIRVVFCLFDDCVFGPKHDPYPGKQADVVPGWYAHDWSPSPGWSRVKDPKTWPKLQQYVQDVLTRFKDDPRVLMWDLYNEPTNGIGDATLPLLTKVVNWAQQVNPSQPLSVGVWNENRKLNDFAINRSDVITFHRYSNASQLEAIIRTLETHGRPLICTEWLKRDWGSVADQLPVFARHRVGCLHWGLVNGKTQTQYYLGSKPGTPEPKIWQHDIFRKDRTPYDPREIELFKQSIAQGQRETPQTLKDITPSPDTVSSETCFLFSYFVGNGEDGLHLAQSSDGYHWQAINGGKSFLAPQVGKSRLMRDPCLLRGPNGTFHLVWTNGWKDQTIGYASSKDLLHWSEQQAIGVMAHEPQTLNCWAPEVVHDEVGQQYVIFWSSTIAGRFPETDGTGDGKYNHRVYSTTTKDFKTFTPTRRFFDGGFNVIDATMLLAEGKYYLIVKDETLKPVKKNLRIAVGDSPEGPFGPASASFTASWVEGPSAIRIGEDYVVYFDCYTKGCYGAVRSRNLNDWEDVTSRVSFPKGARHGTVLRVPKSVVDRLSEAR